MLCFQDPWDRVQASPQRCNVHRTLRVWPKNQRRKREERIFCSPFKRSWKENFNRQGIILILWQIFLNGSYLFYSGEFLGHIQLLRGYSWSVPKSDPWWCSGAIHGEAGALSQPHAQPYFYTYYLASSKIAPTCTIHIIPIFSSSKIYFTHICFSQIKKIITFFRTRGFHTWLK